MIRALSVANATEHAPRRFFAVFVALTALGMGTVAAINIVIDPFDVLRVVDTPWLPNRPAQFGHDRQHKASLIRSERPDGLLVGTSRAQVMLDPEHAVLRDPALTNGATHVVNAAVNGAQPYDVLRLYQHARALKPQKLLVYGLDMLAFDAGGTTPPGLLEERFAVDVDGGPQPLSPFVDVGATILSEDALRSSVSTVRRRAEPSYLKRLGMRDPRFQEADRNKAGGPLEYFRASERDYLANYSCAHPFLVKRKTVVDDTKPMQHLRRLLELTLEDKTRVRLYISPVHARHAVVVDAAGLRDAEEQWKARVAALVDEMRAKGLDVELWDLEGLEPWFGMEPDDKSLSWWESSHATPALGGVVLENLLARPSTGSLPESRRVTAATLPPVLAEIRASQAAWEAGHATEVQEIRVLAADILPAARIERGCAQNM